MKPATSTHLSRKSGPMHFTRLISATLRQLRKQSRQSQVELAERMSEGGGPPIGQSGISAAEVSGRPSWARYASLCVYFRLLPSEAAAAVESALSELQKPTGRAMTPDEYDQAIAPTVKALRKTVGAPGRSPDAFLDPVNRCWEQFPDCLGPALKITRLRLGLTQTQFVELLQKRTQKSQSSSYVSLLESGQKPMSWLRLLVLCSVLQCAPSEIFKAAECLAVIRSAQPGFQTAEDPTERANQNRAFVALLKTIHDRSPEAQRTGKPVKKAGQLKAKQERRRRRGQTAS